MAQLRIPGPTPCPPEVLQVMAMPMVNHRGAEFHQTLAEVTEKIKAVYQTKNDLVFVLQSRRPFFNQHDLPEKTLN